MPPTHARRRACRPPGWHTASARVRARGWALALGIALAGAATARAEAPPLPSGGDATQVSISGISSGAAMAEQYAVAHSKAVRGVAVIAGPGWACAQGRISLAVNACLCARDPLPSHVEQARTMAQKGEIDRLHDHKPQGLTHAFVFHSQGDATVLAPSGQASVAFLTDFMGQAPVVDWGNAADDSDHAGHGFIAPDGGDACRTDGHEQSFVRHCGGEDNARDLFKALYPEVPTTPADRVADIPDADLQPFNQQVYIDAVKAKNGYIAPDDLAFYVWPTRSERRQNLDMAAVGYVYVPPSCRTADAHCRVHVALHGCKQDARVFAQQAGYDNWAEHYRVIMVYPALQPSGSPVSEACSAGEVSTWLDSAWAKPNPNGCWDWWGYLDGGDNTRYLTKAAPQMQVLTRIIEAVTR